MKNLPEKGILIAFGELFLKSEGVRKIFQRKLVQNLSFFLKKEKIDFKTYVFRERIFVALPSVAPSVSEERRRETGHIRKAPRIIKRNFGIVWFAESLYFPEVTLNPVRDYKGKKKAQRGQISNGVKKFSEFVAENYQKWIKKNETFAIRLKLEKGLLKKSREGVIDEIAKNIKRKVNLSKPKREIFVEIRKNGWFLYFKKIKGEGGLPAGTAGKVLTLISGGIDSPIAAFLTTKRGAENIWLHFHSFPLVSRASIEKVKELVKIFLNYQPHLKIYFVPFQKAQIEIKTKVLAKYRILLYRRLMFKIAERITKKENCQALVTGESLGQVSSQTLPNIRIIEEAIRIPVLRPLIGQDKEEIIKIAKKIGTFQISIKPQEDCCTLFVPRHQTAEGRIEIIKALEKKLDINKIIKEIIKKVKIERY